MSDLFQSFNAHKSEALARESRIERVESELYDINESVSRLDTTVNGLYDKMDSFIKACGAGPNTSPGQDASPGRTGGQSSGSGEGKDARYPRAATATDTQVITLHDSTVSQLPPPHVLRAEENRYGAVDRLVMKEDLRMGTGHGKPHNNHDIGIPKPFMYVEREGVETLKQKLDNRNSLTALEYMYATISLLHDSAAFQPADKDAILKHLLCVATDALARPWPAVRKWSQHIWDCVDRGRCTWSDVGFIQEERIRMSYTSGAPSSSNTHPKTQANIITESLLCRDFNSISGCKFQGTHEEGNIRKLHACAFCDAMGRRSNHSIQKCRSRHEHHGSSVPPPGPSAGAADLRQWGQSHLRHGHISQNNNSNNNTDPLVPSQQYAGPYHKAPQHSHHKSSSYQHSKNM